MRKITQGVVGLLVAATAAVGLAATPAVAATSSGTSKQVVNWNGDPNAIVFTTARMSDRGVRGTARLFVDRSGHFQMTTSSHNTNIAWRNVTYKCTLPYNPLGSTHTVTIGRHRVDGKESRNRTGAMLFENEIKFNFNWIKEVSEVRCSMDVG